MIPSLRSSQMLTNSASRSEKEINIRLQKTENKTARLITTSMSKILLLCLYKDQVLSYINAGSPKIQTHELYEKRFASPIPT